MRDPYEVLGVPRNAGRDDIKKAYRELARLLHPDRDPGNARGEDLFKQVAAAYELLSDGERRRQFDHGEIDAGGTPLQRPRPRRDGRRPPKGPFARFFGDRAGKGAAGIKVRGADVAYTVEVDFLEAAHGTTKRVGMTDGKRLDVRIPPGTENGRTLRLKGQGTAGLGGGGAGDALVEVVVEPHPAFRREGDDIHVEVPVTLPEAVLGGRIEVPTIDGAVAVTVPPDSNTGTALRLKGKGVRCPGRAPGDQFVHLKVVLPKRPDPDLVAFVRSWGVKNAYLVRPPAGDRE